jgi:hypothetical protein
MIFEEVCDNITKLQEKTRDLDSRVGALKLDDREVSRMIYFWKM